MSEDWRTGWPYLRSDWPACVDCREAPAATDGRCRDCNIAWLIEQSTCSDCGWWRINDLGESIGIFGRSIHNVMAVCPWMAL